MSTSKLVALRDYSEKDAKKSRVMYLDEETGQTYRDPEGKNKSRKLTQVDFICADKTGRPLKDEDDRIIPLTTLSDAVAKYLYQMEVNQTRGKRSIEMSTPDKDGRLVTMDLSPTDVHAAATVPFFVGGYSIEDGIADMVSPAILVPHQQDVYFTWNDKTDFNRKLPNTAAVGGSVPMVNPVLFPTTYTTVPYALGGYIPTEVQANADTPLRPYEKLVQMVADGLRLEREIRVANLVQTSANWNSNMVTTIAAGAQWDGGPASDPVANMHHQEEQSLKKVSKTIMSTLCMHAMVRNPAVLKFYGFKDGVEGIPDMAAFCRTLGLPPILAGDMKYYTNGGVPTFVWGNHVVMVRHPPQMPPTSQMDNVTTLTFRWSGLSIGDNKVPDGAVTGGFLVRSYFDQRKGPRGSTVCVVTHNDIEVQTSGLVGGLILNAIQ